MEPSPQKRLAEKFKIVLLGDQGVGKTSIINRYINNAFDEDYFIQQSTKPYSATIGIDVLSKNMKVNDKNIRMQLWDTAGQERFKCLIPSYIKQAYVSIVVYDIAKKVTFQSVGPWIADIRSYKGDDTIIVILGNKADLENDRQVNEAEGAAVAKENNAIFYEISARTGANIEEVFKEIAFKLGGAEAPPQPEPGVHKLQNGTSGEGSSVIPPKPRSSCCG